MRLVAVGDLAPLRSLDADGRSREVRDYLRGVDLAMANLEVPLTDGATTAEKAITLRASPGIAASLAEAGIKLVTVANNHALDCGERGLLDTLEAVRGAGVEVVGGGKSLEEAFEPAVVSVGGLKIAVIGAASTLPPGFAAGRNRPGIAPVRVRTRFYLDSITLEEQPGMSPWVETETVAEDVERICAEVSYARERADIVVVQMHWGVPNGWSTEFQGPLADYQRPLAHALIDAGADLVVGHHPHVVHGVERYGRGVVAYSLGNFLFHSMGDDEDLRLTSSYPPYKLSSLSTGIALRSMVLEAHFESGRLHEILFKPVMMNERGDPEFSEDAGAKSALEVLAAQSEELGTSLELSKNEARVRFAHHG